MVVEMKVKRNEEAGGRSISAMAAVLKVKF